MRVPMLQRSTPLLDALSRLPVRPCEVFAKARIAMPPSMETVAALYCSPNPRAMVLPSTRPVEDGTQSNGHQAISRSGSGQETMGLFLSKCNSAQMPPTPTIGESQLPSSQLTTAIWTDISMTTVSSSI